MASPDNALQAGIYSRLTGYAPLTAAIGANCARLADLRRFYRLPDLGKLRHIERLQVC